MTNEQMKKPSVRVLKKYQSDARTRPIAGISGIRLRQKNQILAG
jgi:hypothetical protein